MASSQEKEKSTRERFLELQEELYPKVYRRCLSKTSSHEVANDLTQDIFTRVWAYIEKGNEVRYLHSFIYRVTSNRIKDWYKKKKSTPFARMGDFEPEHISEDSTHESIQDIAEMRYVWRQLQYLGEHYADVIRMRVFEGMSPAEIADELGERTNTISVRLHRGLKRFREILDNEKGEKAFRKDDVSNKETSKKAS